MTRVLLAEADVRAAIVRAALSDLFVPYRWGGDSPSDLGIHPVLNEGGKKVWVSWPSQARFIGGFDCSGGVLRWLREGGAVLEDTTANHLYDRGTLIERRDVLPGDLCFYGKSYASHVAMALLPGAAAIIGANGGDSPKLNETFTQYCSRMSARSAMVRIEDQRVGGYRYRKSDFLGFRRAPLPTL